MVPVAIVCPFRGNVLSVIGSFHFLFDFLRVDVIRTLKYAFVLQGVFFIRVCQKISRFVDKGQRDDFHLKTEFSERLRHFTELSQLKGHAIGCAIAESFLGDEFHTPVFLQYEFSFYGGIDI